MREINESYENLCAALGFFDSVHMGHRKILSEAKSYASAHGLKSAVFTFSNNAYRQFNPQSKLIYTYDERLELFENLGLDYVMPFNFDREFKAMEPEAFLEMLDSRFRVKCFVCGYDYLFGAGGRGDTEMLRAFCAERGLELIVIDKIELGKERVSSTLVKTLLGAGEIERANALLTQPFFMRGRVVKGRGVGHLFDFPTANLSFPSDKLIVRPGVYGTRTLARGTSFLSVTNVGAKPTFDLAQLSVETMIDGFSGDLYGESIRVDFYRYLRDIKRFDSPEALSKQIHKDLKWSELC